MENYPEIIPVTRSYLEHSVERSYDVLCINK